MERFEKMRPLVETLSLSKSYDETEALKNVNVKVSRGEVLAVVGPSGSGKTTLLRLMNLLEVPTSGQIFFDGRDTACSDADRLTLRRRMGMVFQQAVLFNETVHKNVAYPLEIRGYPKEKNDLKVKDALKLVGLSGFEKKRAIALSGGEAQRIALAQAMISEPELLLLDEPTVNLDPRNVSIIESVISKVNREQGTTIILATHNMLQAEQLATKVAVLREGELAQIGDTKEIFRKPSDFLAMFGRVLNVFTGQSQLTEEGTAIIDIGEGFKIEALTTKTGSVTIFIRPEEIIISKTPIVSSARNMLKGKVEEILDLDQSVQLKVDASRQFTVNITKKSYQEMKINLGSDIYLSFKASSVHIV